MSLIKSSKPRKQRKKLYNSKLHEKQKQTISTLTPELRKKYDKRSIAVRKGDVVEIMRGRFKGKKGKVSGVSVKKTRINVEGINIARKDGGEVPVNFDSSNLRITELYKDDEKRFKK